MKPLIRVRGVTKVYGDPPREVVALRGIDVEIGKGEFLGIIGPSGSGKSTLLHLLGGLDTPTEGEVWIDGRSIGSYSDDELTLFRRRRVGFVFQFFNLLPTLTAEENVSLPLLLDGKPVKRSRERSRELLGIVGLSHRADHIPEEMSGGEMQRVAIARALAHDPPIILADEPTGNLDSRTGTEILSLLRVAADQFGRTVIVVTHSGVTAETADRIITIRDGRVVDERRPATRFVPSKNKDRRSLPRGPRVRRPS